MNSSIYQCKTIDIRPQHLWVYRNIIFKKMQQNWGKQIRSTFRNPTNAGSGFLTQNSSFRIESSFFFSSNSHNNVTTTNEQNRISHQHPTWNKQKIRQKCFSSVQLQNTNILPLIIEAYTQWYLHTRQCSSRFSKIYYKIISTRFGCLVCKNKEKTIDNHLCYEKKSRTYTAYEMCEIYGFWWAIQR